MVEMILSVVEILEKILAVFSQENSTIFFIKIIVLPRLVFPEKKTNRESPKF